jgi:ketosteroid isomerase-like protein
MSESDDERLVLLQEGIEAFNRGDTDFTLAIFADNVECHVGPNLVNSGTYMGHDGYLEMIGAWGEAWESITATAIAAEDLENDHLLVEIHQHAVGAGSGVPVEMTLFWLFRFVDGKVTRFHLYAGREAAVSAARG